MFKFSRTALLITSFTFSAFNVHAGIDDQNFGQLTIKQITSVYDGDTFRANIHNVHPLIGERISIRLSNIDTPEIRGKCKKEKRMAQQAKQFTVQSLRTAKKIVLKNVTRGKYFRVVADVYVDGRSLNDALLEKKLAVKYDGGKKNKNWCI